MPGNQDLQKRFAKELWIKSGAKQVSSDLLSQSRIKTTRTTTFVSTYYGKLRRWRHFFLSTPIIPNFFSQVFPFDLTLRLRISLTNEVRTIYLKNVLAFNSVIQSQLLARKKGAWETRGSYFSRNNSVWNEGYHLWWDFFFSFLFWNSSPCIMLLKAITDSWTISIYCSISYPVFGVFSEYRDASRNHFDQHKDEIPCHGHCDVTTGEMVGIE